MFRFLLNSPPSADAAIAEELFATLPLGVAFQDTEGRILAVNPAAVHILGVPREDLIGRLTYDPSWQAQRADGSPCPDDEHSALVALRTGNPVTGFILGVRAREDDQRWLRVTSVPVFTGRDRPAGVYSFFEDITERRVAERGLAARIRQQQVVVELQRLALSGAAKETLFTRAAALCAETLHATTGGILVLGSDGMLHFEAASGWSDDERGTAVPAGPTDSQAGYSLHTNDVVVSDFATETRFRVFDLAKRHGRSGITIPIPGTSGPYGILGIHSEASRHFTDDDVDFVRAVAGILAISVRQVAADAERARLEEHLRQTQKLESIGRLAGGIAHDFNNLMTIVLGYADALASGDGPEGSAPGYIAEIKRAAERAALLTRQLLAFSRQQTLRPKVLDPNWVIANMDRMLRRVIGEDIELLTRLSPDAGHVRVDPGQIEQVLLNIVINARDAMPEGGSLSIETANVELTQDLLRHQPDARPGKYVLISISDTGCGMDRETLARAFEPFFTTKGASGTGLGLATVYGIVKQSDGEVWAYSEPGCGTSINVYLPRVDQPAEAAAADERPRPSGGERILLAEDEAPVRQLLVRTLERFGYEVEQAADGREALDILQERQGDFALVITDAVMPYLGGRELAETIARNWPAIRVLTISGYAGGQPGDGDPATTGLFLQKPFAAAALAAKVREALDSASQTGT